MNTKDDISPHRPDPTLLTSQQLWREIASLKELISVQLAAMEKAIIISHDDLVRVPTEVQKAVASLKELTFARIDNDITIVKQMFLHIKEQFAAIEQIRIEQKRDIATSVDAALKAAKEAVSEQNASNAIAIAKSETAAAKQIEQQGLLITSTSKTLDDKIGDMKERLTKIEGAVNGFEWVRAEVSNLKTGSNKLLGKDMGTKDALGWLLFAIAVIGFLINYLAKK